MCTELHWSHAPQRKHRHLCPQCRLRRFGSGQWFLWRLCLTPLLQHSSLDQLLDRGRDKNSWSSTQDVCAIPLPKAGIASPSSFHLTLKLADESIKEYRINKKSQRLPLKTIENYDNGKTIVSSRKNLQSTIKNMKINVEKRIRTHSTCIFRSRQFEAARAAHTRPPPYDTDYCRSRGYCHRPGQTTCRYRTGQHPHTDSQGDRSRGQWYIAGA